MPLSPQFRWLARNVSAYAGAGAVARLVRDLNEMGKRMEAVSANASFIDKGGAVFNVKAHGARGNGLTNDADAFSEAIAAAEDADGSVYVPHGNFIIDGELTATDKGLHLIGAGKRRAFLTFPNLTGTLLRVLDDSAMVSGLKMIGNGKATGDAVGIHVEDLAGAGPKDVLLFDVEFQDFPVGLHDRGFCTKQWALRFESCGSGIQSENQGGTSSPIGLWINSCDIGIEFVGDVTHYAIRDSNIERCTTGILGGGSTAAPKTLLVSNVHFELNTSRDIDLSVGTLETVLEACRFGGLNSHTNQSIRHAGATTGNDRYALHWLSGYFKDDDTHSNAEIFYVGPRVDLIVYTPDGRIQGCPRSAITLVNTGATVENWSRLVLPGNIGQLQENTNATGSITPDFADGGHLHLTLTGNVTLNFPTNVVPQQTYSISFVQDATGGRTVTWDSDYLAMGTFALASGAGEVTTAHFLALSTTRLMLIGNHHT